MTILQASTAHPGSGSTILARITRPAAFTLIELLVAVSVIALLFAVLLPALTAARQAGRASVCLSALRGAGLAMQMYLDDNEGSFFPYFVDLPGGAGGRRWWFGFEPGGPSANPWQGNRVLVKREGFLCAYMTASPVDLLCPSFPFTSGRYFAKFSPAAGGYGYNTAGLGGHSWLDPTLSRPRKVQELAGQTSDIFALADGIHFDRLDYGGTVPLDQTFNEPAYIQWQDPSQFSRNAGLNGGFAHFRHNDRAHTLYLDGHAAGQPLRRPMHPYSAKGLGAIGNLSDEALRTITLQRGRVVFQVDKVYGLP